MIFIQTNFCEKACDNVTQETVTVHSATQWQYVVTQLWSVHV